MGGWVGRRISGVLLAAWRRVGAVAELLDWAGLALGSWRWRLSCARPDPSTPLGAGSQEYPSLHECLFLDECLAPHERRSPHECLFPHEGLTPRGRMAAHGPGRGLSGHEP